ncbi:regulator [Vibrio vulnificus]|nr:regulator [Vibrio vulnificus]
MTENYIFRERICRLTKEETAELCFKTVRTITGWKDFKMHNDGLELPTGQLVRAQQVLAGMALLEIQSDLEIRTSTHLLGIARAISRIKK